MKRIAILILVILFLYSCEKMGGNNNLLVGKWQLSSIEVETVYADGSIKKETRPLVNASWEFKNDGSVRCIDSSGKIEEFTYLLDKENMILTIGSQQHTLKELSKTSLTTVMSVNFIDGGTVKPAGKGTTNTYNRYDKIN